MILAFIVGVIFIAIIFKIFQTSETVWGGIGRTLIFLIISLLIVLCLVVWAMVLFG